MFTMNNPLLFCVIAFFAVGSALDVQPHQDDHHGGAEHGVEGHHDGVHLYSWRWSDIYYSQTSTFSSPVLVSGLIIFAIVFKILFHHLSVLEKLLPESCVLILVGILFGLIITTAFEEEGVNPNPFPKFSANLFFNILLPPIILDSAISLYNKEFFSTFFSVIIFAVFGTLFNVLTIGLSLYGLGKSGALGGFEFTFKNVSNTSQILSVFPTEDVSKVVLGESFTVFPESLDLFPCLTFGSLIAAVDPVAVLAIFEQIKVNAGLYFLVFGESLFNDGVCVVLYNSMNTLASLTRSVNGHDILMAVFSFFTVAFGGAFFGFLHGIFCSAITRFTKHVRIVEPLTILSCAYSAFLWAELFHWSGIISIISFGVTAKHYAFQNISQKSFTTVKYSVKTLASTSDCIIFLFLGMSILTEKHTWHPGFIVATILLCIIFRFLSTTLFSALVNLKRLEKISLREQLIMWWGGLRGAVGFSLAMVLKEDMWYRELFLTTALVMVLFTVFLQGGTIKLMVKTLGIDLEEDRGDVIGLDVQDKVMEDITQGVLAICGNSGARNEVAKKMKVADGKVRKALIRDDVKTELQRRFESISVRDHMTNLYAPRLIVEKTMTDQHQRQMSDQQRQESVGGVKEEINGMKAVDSKQKDKMERKQFRKQVVKNMGMLRSYSVEEDSGNRSRQMLKEVERRQKAARSMELEVLKEEGLTKDTERLLSPQQDCGDAVIQMMKAQYASVQAKKNQNQV